jgi:hypothetical protein
MKRRAAGWSRAAELRDSQACQPRGAWLSARQPTAMPLVLSGTSIRRPMRWLARMLPAASFADDFDLVGDLRPSCLPGGTRLTPRHPRLGSRDGTSVEETFLPRTKTRRQVQIVGRLKHQDGRPDTRFANGSGEVNLSFTPSTMICPMCWRRAIEASVCQRNSQPFLSMFHTTDGVHDIIARAPTGRGGCPCQC